MSDNRTLGLWVAIAGVVAFATWSGDDVPALGGNSGGDRVCVRDVEGFDRKQEKNAAIIADQAHDMDMPDRAVVVALATAMQESGIRNLANSSVPESLRLDNEGVGHDHDSVGIFQQRPGWGSVEERMTPRYAARAFYRALRGVDDWQDMPVTVAAQTVQVSAFPDAYAQHEDDARRLARALHRCR